MKLKKMGVIMFFNKNLLSLLKKHFLNLVSRRKKSGVRYEFCFYRNLVPKTKTYIHTYIFNKKIDVMYDFFI